MKWQNFSPFNRVYTRISVSVIRDSCSVESRLTSFSSRDSVKSTINSWDCNDQYRSIYCSLHVSGKYYKLNFENNDF